MVDPHWFVGGQSTCVIGLTEWVKISLEGLVLCDISLNKLRGRKGAQRELLKAQKQV